jgi:SdrD B-like domain/Protein of unknown function (DUF3048) C-terminal domain
MRVAPSIAAITLVLVSCAPVPIPSAPVTPTAPPSPTAAVVRSTPIPATALPVPTAQPTSTAAAYGPDMRSFPHGINPLSGLPVADPSLLKIPAVLISISHFPAAARPQAGLSFAPFVYEFSITRGETRFLAAFYGEFPAPEVPPSGDCDVRTGVFAESGTVLGNRVWLDSNHNGVQDPGEGGIPGMCVYLYDSAGGLLGSTTTDSNGIFGFHVVAGRTYQLKFSNPEYFAFTQPNVGNDDLDSDADPFTGLTSPIYISGSSLLWDAGLAVVAADTALDDVAAETPKPEVGPVRSGRLLYAYLGGSYQNSCLIYSFASKEVLPKLPHCAFVSHEEVGGGEMLTIERMLAVAEDNMRHTAERPFDYSSNLYSDVPPAGGTVGRELKVYFGSLNQSAWTYDPLYEAYLRSVDSADPQARGVLHLDVDRLTGRQIHFENVVVIMADTDVVSSTNIDIRLDEGNTGRGLLFRNGRAVPITWSTRAGEYEKTTGFRRPIRFLMPDGSPAPLKPGHTWVIIVTPYSRLDPQEDGAYLVRYGAPEGEAR